MANDGSLRQVEWIEDLDWIEQDEAVDALLADALIPVDDDGDVSENGVELGKAGARDRPASA